MRVMYKNKIWDKEAIQALLDTNDVAVSRALLIVYQNQTADEQSSHETKHHNGIGFTGRDAPFLTDVAKKFLRYGRWASERQLNAVRKCIRKYHRQILEEMSKKDGAEVIKGRVKAPVETTNEVIEPKFDGLEAGAWS